MPNMVSTEQIRAYYGVTRPQKHARCRLSTTTSSHLTDADLLRYVLNSPCLANNVRIALLSARYVAKAIELADVPDVETTIEFALSLGVRAPCIRADCLRRNELLLHHETRRRHDSGGCMDES
jgi:hypothetical protein